MKKWIISIVVLILVIGGGATWYLNKGESKEITAINRTATVKQGMIETKVSGSGSLSPTIDEDVTVTENHTIDQVDVANGDVVKKGDELLSYTDGTVLDAPADGTISNLTVYDDSRVNAGQVVLHLTNYKNLSTVISVDELDVPEVKVGQAVDITVNAYPDKVFTGKVTAIAQEGTVNNGVSSFDVTVHVDNPGDTKAGMTTTAEIITNKVDNVIYVPVDAVHKNGDTSYVLVVDPNANESKNADTVTTKQVAVVTGAHNDSDVEVKSGLTVGQIVELPQITRSQNGASGNGQFPMMGSFGGGFRNGNLGGRNFGGQGSGSGNFSSRAYNGGGGNR